jgi:predicted transposase YdaD
MERVANMQLYQEKYQLKYLTENDAKMIWEKSGDEKAVKMATNMLKKNKYTIEEISEATELTIERVKELQEGLYKKE